MDAYLKMRKYEDKDGLQQIQIIYSYKGEVLKLDTNVKTKSIYWTGLVESVKKKDKILRGRVTSRCAEIGQNHIELNDRLKDVELDIDGIITAFRKSHHFNPDITTVREEYNKEEQKIFSDPEVKEQLSLWIPKKKNEVKESTLKIYFTLLHDLINLGLSKPIKKWKKLSEEDIKSLIKNGKPIYFRQIDKAFKDKYIKYLEKIGCQNPTINKRFQALRAFMNSTYEDGINQYTEFQKFHVNRPEIAQEVIIPSPEQFIKLLTTNFPSPRLEYARSLFVLSCVSGLRYSDIMQIDPSVFRTNGEFPYLRIIQKKVRKEVLVPLHPIGEEILKKYDNTVIKISNQKLNDALEDVFKKLEFNDTVTVYTIYGNEDPDHKSFKKWEKMRFHSGRRFFCSMLVNGYEGFRLNYGNVKKLSGHSSAVLGQYVKEGEKVEEEMLELFSRFIKNPKK